MVGEVFLAFKLRHTDIKQFTHHESDPLFLALPYVLCPFKKNMINSFHFHFIFPESKVQGAWFTIPVFLAKTPLALVNIVCLGTAR